MKNTICTELQNSIERSQILFKELVIVKEIGEGSYGKVFFGKWNDAPVALKFCRNKGNLSNFLGEIKVMLYGFSICCVCECEIRFTVISKIFMIW